MRSTGEVSSEQLFAEREQRLTTSAAAQQRRERYEKRACWAKNVDDRVALGG